MRLSDLEKYHPITIQCHDNPDADAIGSGYGLYRYFADKGCRVRLIYSGHNKIQKANLKLMIDKLNIPIEYIAAATQKTMEGLLVTVDCQYGAGNVTHFKADRVAVIDHHPMEIQDLDLFRIQPNLGSCATLVWSMLMEAGYPVSGDINLGTALYYGLYMDTNQFSELCNPLDMDMRDNVTVNKALMKQFRHSNLSLKELEIASIAMLRYHYNEEHRFAVIQAQPCDPNILGLISDFLLQVDEIDVCVVYNVRGDGFKFSVRSCIKEVNANELAGCLAENIGSGGGHYEKAGGFISIKQYEKQYPGLHSEAYFNNRMTEYFDSFTIMSARDMHLDMKRMKKYRRRKEPICCLRATDVAKPGFRISIRTQKGSVDSIVKEGLYFAIERDGTVHPMWESHFESCLSYTEQKISKEYYEDTEYMPTIKAGMDDRLYLLEDYARMCMPRESFCIYAMALDKCVKLFPEWDEDKYMLGMPGDYLAASMEDSGNVFIEPGDNFFKRFEQI